MNNSNRTLTDFDPQDIQQLDATGYYVLHADYLLSYRYSDGFTERLLRMDAYIDGLFICKVNLEYRKKQGAEYTTVSQQFEIDLPDTIKNLLTQLTEQEALHLKHYYADTQMEDASQTDFVINHKGKSYNVGMGIYTKKPAPENEAEYLLFQLTTALEQWREALYKT